MRACVRVCAGIHSYLAIAKDNDFVCVAYSGEAVCNDNHSAAMGNLVQGTLCVCVVGWIRPGRTW